MSRILVVDTSSPAVTAAVVHLGAEPVLAGLHAPLDARGHTELLAPAMQEALAAAGTSFGELDAVVAGLGPGPFTGLRVGLVTAAAVADALGVPVYGVPSLDAIGAACGDEPSLLVATDARRREVYWGRYRHGVREGDLDVSRPAELDLTGVTALAGAGAELYADVWPQLPRRPERYPDPVALVALARDRLESGAPADTLVPLYLRRPDAVVPGAPKAVSR